MGNPDPRAVTGQSGEALARRYLEERGYRFIAHNWHCPAGELDLVMQDGRELVFVEVKTRHGERSGRAGDAVTRAKVRRLFAAADHFIAAHPQYDRLIWRCDLVAITIHPATGRTTVRHEINALVEDH